MLELKIIEVFMSLFIVYVILFVDFEIQMRFIWNEIRRVDKSKNKYLKK